MMSCDRAIVSVPPFTGEPLLPDALELPPPPPHAVRATAAVAAVPANLTRFDRVIDCLIVRPARAGGWRAPAGAGDGGAGVGTPGGTGPADRSVHYSRGEVFPCCYVWNAPPTRRQ